MAIRKTTGSGYIIYNITNYIFLRLQVLRTLGSRRDNRNPFIGKIAPHEACEG
jgi:hypothetical protein